MLIQLGQNIKKYRKIKGLSQKELAKSIGVSHSYISHIETGASVPSIDILLCIARYFHIPIDYLLKDSSEETMKQSTLLMLEELDKADIREIYRLSVLLTSLIQIRYKELTSD